MSSSRGEYWVLVQIILLVAIALVPNNWIAWPDGLVTLSVAAGVVIGLIGAAFLAMSAVNLGPNLTVFPRPKDDGSLVQSGIYGLVRHPMYFGVIAAAIGWSLLRTNVIGVVLSIALIMFFDRKAAREEVWLREKFPDYGTYQQRVRKLIPFVY
jgi:protein-S-isoprenylcysteine O-methyltransferase Ste14